MPVGLFGTNTLPRGYIVHADRHDHANHTNTNYTHTTTHCQTLFAKENHVCVEVAKFIARKTKDVWLAMAHPNSRNSIRLTIHIRVKFDVKQQQNAAHSIGAKFGNILGDITVKVKQTCLPTK